VIGRRAWPRCQQIHAIADMLHGRRDGESEAFAEDLGPKSLLYLHFQVLQQEGLSSGCLLCSAETKLIGSDAPHNQRPASQRLPRPRPDCQSTARHPQPQSPSNVFACTGISELQSSRSTPGHHQMEP